MLGVVEVGPFALLEAAVDEDAVALVQGLGGVMEPAYEGAAALVGGVSVGLLPGGVKVGAFNPNRRRLARLPHG